MANLIQPKDGCSCRILAAGILLARYLPCADGGKAEVVVRAVLRRGQPLVTFDVAEKEEQIKVGAQPNDCHAIRMQLAPICPERTGE
jgi:hypothetical protein